MSRKAAPKPEELIQKLEEKVDKFKEEVTDRLGEQAAGVAKLQEDLEACRKEHKESGTRSTQALAGQGKELGDRIEEVEVRQTRELGALKEELSGLLEERVGDLAMKVNERMANMSSKLDSDQATTKEKIQALGKQLDDHVAKLHSSITNKLDEVSSHVAGESSSSQDTREQLDELNARIEGISEKMYEFEANKRNNLIFYGLGEAQGDRETGDQLRDKVLDAIRHILKLRRTIAISSASRLLTGPIVSGSRPVLVTFEEFKDREEVLRKGGMMKNSGLSVTEDMSRRIRESRQELRKFMRESRRTNPAAQSVLQGDKLYVDHKCYVWSDLQAKVVEHSLVDEPGEALAASLRSTSPSPRLPPPSVTPPPQGGGEEVKDSRMDEMKDMRIQQLEETVRQLQEKLEAA